LFLAGSQVQQLVKYEVVDGLAVMEGDIVLGPASTLPLRLGLPWAPATNVKSAVALSNRSHLWPRSEIPYVIDRSVSPSMIDGINWAIAQLNTTPLRVRPRTASDNDYVVFVDSGTGSGCSSYVGRIGGPQEIQTADCGKGSLIHEILHAAGFYHEQSRGDRDAYVTIVWDEIAPGYEDNFEKRDGRGQDIGPYDYSSIMHYSSHAFSRSGRPTIIPKVPNAKIGQREGLSDGDRAAIAELYGNGPGPGPSPTPPTPTPPPTPPTPPSPPAPPMPWNGSFAGNYTSNRGNVACAQSGTVVNCQYPGGVLFCSANNTQLDCGWTGGGQGRATFQRQPNGVLAGTWGDFFSNNSRGQWDLVPVGGPQPAPPPSPQPKPQPQPQPPPSGSTSLTGDYASTRGPMTCTDAGATVSCTFREPTGLAGRLDCTKDATGRELSCTWVTLLPPASGRAVFTRRSPTERNLTGTWGYFNATSGGGVWEATGQ
jgi:hypothetical protein